MRLGVVFRSVAVLLAAPLLALPAGGAEESAPPAAAGPIEARPVVARPAPAARVASPRRPHLKPAARRAGVTADGAERERPARPIAVHVDCAHDGCVVVEGLDVRVVGP